MVAPQEQVLVPDSTPILVGVGQYTERVTDADFIGLAPYELAARAARRACEDAGATNEVAAQIDTIAATRTFEDSGAAAAPFGKSDNFPRSIARRMGIEPRLAIWTKAGGDSPQTLLIDLCRRLAAGEIRLAMMAGGEAISTVRYVSSLGQTRDFNDHCAGDVEDHGSGVEDILRPYHVTYRLASAPATYALCEHARRAKLKLSRDEYARHMGILFAPFTGVAAANPYSSAPVQPMSPVQLIEDSERNRLIADPYRVRLVARDQVNQAAAVLLTTVAHARRLGIPQRKWVFVHGYAMLQERELLERIDLGASKAAQHAARAALDCAQIAAHDVSYFDFYSCFPIAVSNVACDALGLSPEDPRLLSVTGGLPFFGGPGNNYSLHAIATMAMKLRARPGAHGFVGANGGFLSKYAACVYSTQPTAWRECDGAELQRRIDAEPAPPLAERAEGAGLVETYTILYKSGKPFQAVVIGRMSAEDRRCVALSDEGDEQTLQRMIHEDPLRASIRLRGTAAGNRFTFR